MAFFITYFTKFSLQLYLQDMFDPEYFMSEYEIRDLSNGTIRLASGRYRDFADAGPREEILYDDCVRDERQSYYCISVPGEASWVQDAFKSLSPDCGNSISNEMPSTSNPTKNAKRILEDNNQMEVAPDVPKQNQKNETSDKLGAEKPNESTSTEEKAEMDVTSGDSSANKRTKTTMDNKEEMDTSEVVRSTNNESKQCLNLPIPNSKGNKFKVKDVIME